jgi:hypothetical protein
MAAGPSRTNYLGVRCFSSGSVGSTEVKRLRTAGIEGKKRTVRDSVKIVQGRSVIVLPFRNLDPTSR